MKNILIFLFFLFLSTKGTCQLNPMGSITPMHKFFQQYADSTIIIEYQSEGYPPRYRVLSKTDTIVNSFCYEAIDTTWKNISSIKATSPVVLWNMLLSKKTLFQDIPADINIFFNITPLPADSAKKVWKYISKLEPWDLVDDKTFGYGCKNVEDPVISENKPDIIHLITRAKIKTLMFQSPFYFEKLCPGNKNRQVVNKMYKIFHNNFPEFKGKYW